MLSTKSLLVLYSYNHRNTVKVAKTEEEICELVESGSSTCVTTPASRFSENANRQTKSPKTSGMCPQRAGGFEPTTKWTCRPQFYLFLPASKKSKVKNAISQKQVYVFREAFEDPVFTLFCFGLHLLGLGID